MRYIFLALVPASFVFGWAQLRFRNYEAELLSVRGDAAFERERADAMLSNGRWVRSIDARTGISTYRFARRSEQH